ncbi:MAG: hypothetical protein JEY94_19090 [Melioribacteraceae bacterium]|nr:hypothetical protein [Melioribacteraceae bacterium]
MKKISLLLIGLMLILSGYSQSNKKIDWDSDLDYIAKMLPEKHFNLFTVKSNDEYLNGIENIRNNKSKLSDFEIAISLQQLIAGFGDSHTKVKWGQLIDQKQLLPLHLYWFNDGIYILHTTNENKDILGHQLLSINNIEIKKIVNSLSTLITVDNRALIKSSIPKLLPSVQLLKYFGVVKNNKIELKLMNSKGETKLWNIKPDKMNRQNRISFKPDSLALCFKNERIFFIDYYQKEDGIYYVQYNKCSSSERERMYGRKDADEKPSINEFTTNVLKVLNTKPIKKFVFDMRFNTGGSSNQGTKLIEKISAIQKQKPEMKLYVVLGRHTFSAAIINAMDFKRLTDAVYLGEETSGKPNHFGELWDLKLPNSGITVLYSTKYFKETDEEMNSLKPDVQLEPSFDDFRKGIDPVYDWIREQ